MEAAPVEQRLNHRSRVVARYAAAVAHPIAVIVAPAGCGKSVALDQFLSHLDCPIVRIELQSSDDGLLGLARSVTAAMREIAPDARSGVADAAMAAMRAPDAGSRLARWVSGHFARFGGVVALDDLHIVLDDPQCIAFVTDLIDRTKDTVRWVLSTRSVAGLPISSWMAYGHAGVPIDERDLALTAAEARETAAAYGVSMTPDEIDHLLGSTAGWITAFALALHEGSRAESLAAAIAFARERSDKYLTDHVLNQLDGDERSLVLLCAVLGDFDVDVLVKAGYPYAGRMLADLCKRVTFLRAAPPRSGEAASRRYRCHDIFRGFLERYLERDECRRALRCRAAEALLACDRPIEALRLYAEAKADKETLEMLRAHGFDLTHLGHADTLQLALRSLPEVDRDEHPVAIGLRAFSEALVGRYDRACELYQRAIASSQGDPVLRATLAARSALSSINSGRNPAKELEPLAHDETLPADMRGELLSLLAMSHGRFGDFERITPALLDALESFPLGPVSALRRLAIQHRVGIAAYLFGDGARAERLFAIAARSAVECGTYRHAAIICANAAENATANLADFTLAVFEARRSCDYASKSGDEYILRFTIGRYMDVTVNAGDERLSSELLEAYAAIPGPDRPIDTEPTRAMLAACRGDFGQAYRLMTAALAVLWKQEERMVAHALCALFAVGAEERAAAAAHMVDAWSEGVRKLPHPSYERSAAIVQSLCAVTLALSGKAAAARRLLAETGETGDRLARALWNAATAVVRELDSGSEVPVDSDDFEHLRELGFGAYATIFVTVLERRRAQRHGPLSLTSAEAAILQEIAAGRSTREIAARNGCSVHTVRWHIRRIIEKCGCSGRDQAVRIAQTQHLL